MILWALSAAAQGVDTLDCARVVEFAAPYRWSWAKDVARIDVATAVVVRADPALLAPRPLAQPVLYVGGWPAEVLAWDADRALVLAPMRLDGPIRAWFGDDTLPERVDAAHRKASQERASQIQPLKPTWSPPLRWFDSRSALVARLRAWMSGCMGG